MNIYKTKEKQTIDGFTIIETIVALSVALIVILGMMQVFITGYKHMRAVRADTSLASNVAYVSQTLARKVHTAKEIKNVTSTSFDIEPHVGTSEPFLWDPGDDSLKLDGKTLTNSEVEVLSFTSKKVGNSIHISFTLGSKQVPSRTFDGQTTFTPRK